MKNEAKIDLIIRKEETIVEVAFKLGLFFSFYLSQKVKVLILKSELQIGLENLTIKNLYENPTLYQVSKLTVLSNIFSSISRFLSG